MRLLLKPSFHLLTALAVLTAGRSSAGPADLLFVQRGDLPIILTAPHGGTQAIAGVPARTNGVTVFDAKTSELAQEVSAALEKQLGRKPYVVAAKFSRKFLDVNREEAAALENDLAKPVYQAFHWQMREFVDEARQKFPTGALLIDLHGQGKDTNTIHRGTQNGLTVKRLTEKRGMGAFIGPDSVLGRLRTSGHDVFPPNTPPGEPKENPSFNGGYIVRTYGSHTANGVDAIQLESGTALRINEARRKKYALDLATAIAAFYKAYLLEAKSSSARDLFPDEVSVACAGGAEPAQAGASTKLPSLEEALASGRDVWGEAAMRQPNGPSYEFFTPLLPPPRYVHADFRHYPIVLSAPNQKIKARLISNGSGVNLAGGSRSWHDTATPVTFRVGPDEFLFGGLRDRTSEPELAEGWLPIVEVRYSHRSPLQSGGVVPLDQPKHELPPEVYRLEAFAATDPTLASNGVVFVKFDLAQGTNGFLAVEVDGKSANKFADGKLTDPKGQLLALFDASWKFERGMVTTRLTPKKQVTLAIPTKPLDAGADFKLTSALYAQHRETAAQTWRKIVSQAMQVETPEPLVNNAWRHLICQNFSLITGDRMHYSAGNQYDQLYEAEGSDTALAMLWWGYERDMRRLVVPLLDFTRKGLEFHQAGFKINDVCQLYWQTRDAVAVKELRPRWEKEVRRLVDNRTGPDGLFPKEQYCGDIHTPCFSLNANAKAWRAIRDMSAVLGELGETAEATRYADVAADFRKATLAAVAKSVNRSTTPPFVPVALFGDEPVHDPILHSRIGSYWNIIIGYTMASGIFPPGSEEANWIARYQEQHGGLCMGMIRSGGGQFTFWTSDQRVNPLYGTRYALDTLRRDDPERALVCFYGMLAQGFTRNTFVTGEGCALSPVDDGGRFFYCPPNSAGNAHFLSMLRHLLVQDLDLDDDGKSETLRLGFATPKRWLEDGKEIKVEHAPTAFGEISLKLTSHLSRGEVIAEIEAPKRSVPKKTLLRIRLPDGWKVESATAGGTKLMADAQGTVDVSALRGSYTVTFRVKR